MTDRDSIHDVAPPTVSHGDLAMLARVEQRLFGSTHHVPRQIGRYAIEERLGAGGMGVVYLAHDSLLDRRVALKLLGHKVVSDEARARLIQEARVLAKLSHPNVVQVHDVGEHDDDVYIAMEYVEGQNLARWQRDAHPWREVVATYLAAGAGLAAAHASAIVHCDFKPANVLLGVDGQIKVADFGLARGSRDDAATDRLELGEGGSASVRIMGTPGYVAPELWLGAEPDARSDQFAFCVALWEALSGQRPYIDTRRLAHPMGVIDGPRWLGRAVARGLRVDPERRWQSLAALLHELEARPRRRRWVLASFGVLTAFVATLARPEDNRDCAMDPGLEVWTPTFASELRDKGVVSGTPGATTTAEVIIEELYDYQVRWNSASREMCERRYFDGTVSTSDPDLGRICLRRARVRALVLRDVLLDSEGLRLAEAESLMDELVDPRACLDEVVPARGPTGLGTMLGAWEHEFELGQLRAAFARGDYERALALSERLLATPGVRQAEVLILRGRVETRMGRRVDAHGTLREASRAAVLAGELVLAFEAQLALAELSARDLENELDARSWLTQAATTFKLLGESPLQSAQYGVAEALVLEAEHQPELALARLRMALDELVALGADDRELERARLRLANLSAKLGNHEQAMSIYHDLLTSREIDLGPSHPMIGVLAFNIGDSLVQLRQWPSARPMLERALDIERTAYGDGALPVASISTRLAEVEVELGNYERAESLARSAWETQRTELSRDDDDFGSALVVLAWIHVRTGNWEEALADYGEILAQFDLDSEGRAAVHQSMAWLLCRQQKCREAEPHIELARAGEGRAVQLRVELVAAESALARSDTRSAVERAERVLADLPGLAAAEQDPALEVEAWAILGLALAQSGDIEGATQNLLNVMARETDLVTDPRERSRLTLLKLQFQHHRRESRGTEP
jgi:tetratricopeptide (TPR) repeat protein